MTFSKGKLNCPSLNYNIIPQALWVDAQNLNYCQNKDVK